MSKRQEMRDKRQRQDNMNRGFIIGGIVLFAALAVFFLILPSLMPIPDVVDFTTSPRLNANANTMGDPNAPIKMEEFSDYQCPFCKHFADDTEAAFEEAYVATGKVYFVYRSMGNWVSQNSGGGKTESRDAAMAAYCAGDQNKYWEMHDALFANALGEDAGFFVLRRLSAIAAKAGLDMNAYESCMSSNKFLAQTDQDYQDGLATGMKGTPSFLLTYTVNGETKQQIIEGAQPFSAFQQVIDAVLAEMGQ
jgi:protein-disulfide isomerase